MKAPLDYALAYIRRGWNPVPIPFRLKRPVDPGWQERIITEGTATQYFNGKPQNIGIVLGPSSNGLTDVDLDCQEAIDLAPYLLPQTNAIFGRASKQASHWLYMTDLAELGEKATVTFQDPLTGKMIVELRIGGQKGAQTVFPGSMHGSGEIIEWVKSSDPAKIHGAQIRLRVTAIAVGSLLVRHWPGEGSRHKTALALGGLLSRVGWSGDAIKQFVGAVASVAHDDEVEDRIRAAQDAAVGIEKGEHVYGLPALARAIGEPVAETIAEWLGYQSKTANRGARFIASATRQHNTIASVSSLEPVITQDGLARIFADRYANHLRFCHSTGAWFQWIGSHWQRDHKQAAFQLIRELGRECSERAPDKELRSTRHTAFASGVERFARSDPGLAVTIANWDQDAFLLGTPSGTVDLRTGELRTAESCDGITKLTAVAPAKSADCPRWLDFLDETTGGDTELIRFLWHWCGYSLTGDTREHALVFVYGPGGNGKSVFLNVLTGILKDYATTAAMDTFTASKGDKHPTDLAMLRGARLVTASETEEGRAWAESRIKQMTGGDPLTARFMRQDFFTFQPSFKLTIVGNHQPMLRNVDEAAKRRFNIVPFTRKPATPDRQLEEKLKSEWPGILRWMIEGCIDWQEKGLARPQSVTDATADYFAEQDLFSQWLEDNCDVERDNSAKWARSCELFASWSAYAKAAGEDPGTTKGFSPNMRRKGFKPYRNMSARGWSGIRLKPEYRSRYDT